MKKSFSFLNVDGYIKDAEREGNAKCANILREIKVDEEKHALLLKDLLGIK